MLFYLISVPILVLILIIQVGVVSNLPMMYGNANLMMLVIMAWALQERSKKVWDVALIGGALVGFVTAVPFYVPMLTFLAVAALAKTFRRRIWRIPIFLMILMSIFGTFFEQIFTVIVLQLSGSPLLIRESIFSVILPSALINLLISIPVFSLVTDLGNWVYPIEVEG
jgi:hypothetical protein